MGAGGYCQKRQELPHSVMQHRQYYLAASSAVAKLPPATVRVLNPGRCCTIIFSSKTQSNISSEKCLSCMPQVTRLGIPRLSECTCKLQCATHERNRFFKTTLWLATRSSGSHSPSRHKDVRSRSSHLRPSCYWHLKGGADGTPCTCPSAVWLRRGPECSVQAS